MSEQENIVLEKSKTFALRIIRLYQYLQDDQKEFILSKQILRSGTSIGANVKEAQCAQTKKDFIAKMYIALKEAAETEYWIELLFKGNFLPSNEAFQSIWNDNRDLLNLLGAITKNDRHFTFHISYFTL